MVYDKSVKVNGKQRSETSDGYIVPLNVWDGLLYMTIRPFTDHEEDILPHVVLTADADWDLSILDFEQESAEEWYNAMEDIPSWSLLSAVKSGGYPVFILFRPADLL